MATRLENGEAYNPELISTVCEDILSKIKVAGNCILYDEHGCIDNSFIADLPQKIEKLGDNTGLEMWHNEVRLSDYSGFSIRCIIPFVEMFKQRLNTIHPRTYCFIVYVTDVQTIDFRFHVYRKDEGMWLVGDIEEENNPLLYDLDVE